MRCFAVCGMLVCVVLAVAPAAHAVDLTADAGHVASDDTLTRPQHPRGWVMLIHGGAWVLTGQQYLLAENARWLNRHGLGTYDIDYRGGSLALPDVLAAYDHLRRLVGSKARICADGQSAGGHLAMLLAAARPGVACVISEAGITDLTTSTGWVRAGATIAFGQSLWSLWWFSPVRLARRIKQPMLLAGSTLDPVVAERAQLSEMKRARPQTETLLLPGAANMANFPHAGVRPCALSRLRNAELALARNDREPPQPKPRRLSHTASCSRQDYFSPKPRKSGGGATRTGG